MGVRRPDDSPQHVCGDWVTSGTRNAFHRLRWFQDGQRFPGDERRYPALEPSQVVVVHDVEHALRLPEMLVGSVQRGVGRNDADVVQSQEPFAHAFWICDGDRALGAWTYQTESTFRATCLVR